MRCGADRLKLPGRTVWFVGARQNWSKPAISWELNPKTGVRTTDFTDDTDKEGIAVPGVFTRRVAAKEVLDLDEALSHPCYP